MRTILIIDDDEAFREMLRAVLETRGIEVLVAENTAEGLILAACREIDAVLTDYQMPGQNGLEFCRALRRQFAPLGAHVPVWVMTGCISLTAKEALAAGAEGIFRKPFRVVEITQAIERHLQLATSETSIAR